MTDYLSTPDLQTPRLWEWSDVRFYVNTIFDLYLDLEPFEFAA